MSCSVLWEFWGRDPPGRRPGRLYLCPALLCMLSRPGRVGGGAGPAHSLEGGVYGPGAGVVGNLGRNNVLIKSGVGRRLPSGEGGESQARTARLCCRRDGARRSSPAPLPSGVQRG